MKKVALLISPLYFITSPYLYAAQTSPKPEMKATVKASNKNKPTKLKKQRKQTINELENTEQTSDPVQTKQGPLTEKQKLQALAKNAPKLSSELPFQSYCGDKLSSLPPNKILILDFAQKAVIQSFTYDYANVSEQFTELEQCYTRSGWNSFTNALSKSGNLRYTSDEKLYVTSKVNGDVDLLEENIDAPYWKVMVPIEVRYENNTHYLIQKLKVKLIISVENKELGVEQIIASDNIAAHKYEKPFVENPNNYQQKYEGDLIPSKSSKKEKMEDKKP